MENINGNPTETRDMELTSNNNTKSIHTTFSSLKTRAGAVARVEKALSNYSIDELGTFRYVIASNDDGTFAPVVFLNNDQKWIVADIAERGIVCVG